MRLRLVLLAVTLVVGGSCGDDDSDDESSGTSATELDGTSWSITSLESPEGTQSAPGEATLAFADGSLSVGTGCNTGGGDATLDEDSVTVGPLNSTLIACEGELATWETALFAFLEGELGVELSDDELVLTKDDSTLTLESAD